MGFFKKIFKGIGKVFKKIGRGIKKAFKSFGKFMGKIGFVGQMAMMFLFPGGIGNFLLKGLGKLGSTLAAVSGNGMFATAVQGIGKILTGTQKFITAAKAGFSSITNGIMEFGKTALNKIPGINIESAAQNFFVTDGGLAETAWQRTKDGFSEVSTLFKGLRDGKLELSREFKDIKELSNKVGITVNDLKELNPDLPLKGIIDANTEINVNLTEFYKSGKLPAEVVQEALVEPEGLTGFRRDAAEYLGKGNLKAGTEMYQNLLESEDIQNTYKDYLKERGADVFTGPVGYRRDVADYLGKGNIERGTEIYEGLLEPKDVQNKYNEYIKQRLEEGSVAVDEEQGFISRTFEKGREELFGADGRYNPDKPFSTGAQMYKDAQMIAAEIEGVEDVEDPRFSMGVADILPGASIGTGDDPTALRVNRFGDPAGTNMLSIYGYTPSGFWKMAGPRGSVGY